MNPSQVYFVIALAVMVILAGLLYAVTKDKKARKVYPITALAFALILAGLLVISQPLIAYGLMAAGVIAAVVDMFKRAGKI